MVDITHKSTTHRTAIAEAIVTVSLEDTMLAIQQGRVPKGDVFSFSRAAGLLGIKRTWESIPDCHPLPVEFASIRFEHEEKTVRIRVEVQTVYKTGVEVEAMHGAAITALTMYDMLKPIDPDVRIGGIHLITKSGGKSDIKHSWSSGLTSAVVTVNAAVLSGKTTDTSGDVIAGHLARHGLATPKRLVIEESRESIRAAAETLVHQGVRLILFSGGSGLQPTDVTPDVMEELIDREVPGIMETIRNYGQQRTPYALLGRGVAGFSGESLIITLPGSIRGADESMHAVFPQILHVFRSIIKND